MFNAAFYYNSRPDGLPVMEIVAGTKIANKQRRLFVPLKRSELEGEIYGPLASLHLTQVFGFSRAECPKVLEAVYRFPLPGDAAVTGVGVQFGEVEILAELKPRRQAQDEYDEAKRQGQQAALVTRESPDVFTLRVAGIEPDQSVTVETSYVQLAKPEGSGWTLRVPLTTAPRYVRSDEFGSAAADGQPLVLLRDPGHRFALDLSLPGAGLVESRTHALAVDKMDGGLRVQLSEGEVLPDRDCVLFWQLAQEERHPSMRVYTYADEATGQVYFLALALPPGDPDSSKLRAREVILLVDHSGSMEGAKWEASDWAVKKFLSELGEGDAFALGVFHNLTTWFADEPQRAETHLVEQAVKFLEEHRDTGGTELGVALEQALDLDRTKGEFARHVLIITDAEVTDAGRILRLADEEGKQKERRRISVLCIDAAPNSFLASQLAERGGGLARFLTSAPEEEDISTALDEVLLDWSQPVLTGLRLEVNSPRVQAAGRDLLAGRNGGRSAIDLGDLPAGRAIWVAGRTAGVAAGDLQFRLVNDADGEVASFRSPPPEAGPSDAALKALFGTWRTLALEFLIHAGYDRPDLEKQLDRLGYDGKEILGGRTGKRPKLYAENVRQAYQKALQDLLVREALEYGLATSETAFVAVRKEKGKPVQETVVVANALPAGWSDQFLPGVAPAAMPRDPLRFAAQSLSLARPQAAPGATGAVPPPIRETTPTKPKNMVLFLGVPKFDGAEALLFDSARDDATGRLPGQATFSRLRLHYLDPAPSAGSIGPGLALLIFVDDLSSPRAKVRIVDLMRQGGERPLNILRRSGQPVRIVLSDPSQVWAAGMPAIEVSLGW